MKKQTKYLILLLLLTQVLAIYGCYYLFGGTPTDCLPETEEKAFFYREKEPMRVLNNEKFRIPDDILIYSMYNNGKKVFSYDYETPTDYNTIEFLKIDSLNYKLNVHLITNSDTIKVNLDLSLGDCTQYKIFSNYHFKVLGHPWINTFYMTFALVNNEYLIESFDMKEYNRTYFHIGREYSINFELYKD